MHNIVAKLFGNFKFYHFLYTFPPWIQTKIVSAILHKFYQIFMLLLYMTMTTEGKRYI